MAASKKLNLPGSLRKTEDIKSMLRVNHAGEFGAKRIYEGQISILKSHSSCHKITHMYQQELQHLKYFETELISNRVRPTLFMPIWGGLAFLLGKLSGALGSKAAMTCTVAVEEVIDEHYHSQIKKLQLYGDEKLNLSKKIEQFRQEEIEHSNISLDDIKHDIGDFRYKIFKAFVIAVTNAAIAISKKI